MTDTELKQHVQNALDWEPSIDASDISVSVDESVVTLRGTVGSYVEKVSAERVALRVYGVKAVANDLSVHLVSGYERTDTEIAQAAVAALEVEHGGASRSSDGDSRERVGDIEWHARVPTTRARRPSGPFVI